MSGSRPLFHSQSQLSKTMPTPIRVHSRLEWFRVLRSLMVKEFGNIKKLVFGHNREPAVRNNPIIFYFSPCLRASVVQRSFFFANFTKQRRRSTWLQPAVEASRSPFHGSAESPRAYKDSLPSASGPEPPPHS